ncbi:MAG: GntR family transcriptional regulator [Syntrophomonadaceae bacterium]|mgnify:CR=1 FL=1|jgi:GntR family transcriptional regulator|nr:GntR family transcriptional regulator [Bacillota bacterium]NLP24507.1 GntR family transcriptional regulator [Syntrophomonadaceae bacterium]
MNFDAAQPIYRQIIDEFKKKIIRGELKKGDRIPSQREYAEMVRVNPNTVQRAYREMEVMQMVETVRGQGTFVVVDQAGLASIKEDMAKSILTYFVTEMNSLGYSDQDLAKALEQYLRSKEAVDQ